MSNAPGLKFQFIMRPGEAPRVTLGGADITNEVMGLELKIIPGQIPHVNLGVKIETAEVDIFNANVTKQVVAGETKNPETANPPEEDNAEKDNNTPA